MSVIYNVTFGTELQYLNGNDFESPDEVGEFINECLIEHGEGEFQITVSAFDPGIGAEDEVIEDEP